jgi:hypothetical protein
LRVKHPPAMYTLTHGVTRPRLVDSDAPCRPPCSSSCPLLASPCPCPEHDSSNSWRATHRHSCTKTMCLNSDGAQRGAGADRIRSQTRLRRVRCQGSPDRSSRGNYARTTTAAEPSPIQRQWPMISLSLPVQRQEQPTVAGVLLRVSRAESDGICLLMAPAAAQAQQTACLSVCLSASW